jgi:hypothetical protein
MKTYANYIGASLTILILSVIANGSAVVFTTPAGSTIGGDPVNAQATFTTSTDTIQVLLQNLQVNPTTVAQNLSDLFLTLSTGQKSGTLSSSSGTERTVAGGGSFTNGSTVSTGWALSTSGSGLELNVLGTPVGPAHTIIGPPGAGPAYPNANASIAGNGPHNPFLGQSASFTLHVPGVTASSVINSATFSFGTEEGSNVPGTSNNVPDPATLSILFMGGAIVLRRRQATNLG